MYYKTGMWKSTLVYAVLLWLPTELKGAEAELEAQTHNLTEARERWNDEGRSYNTLCIHTFRS